MAAVMAFESKMPAAVIGIFVCAILDFFDGFTARILNARSELGKNLDSLSDLISFGLAPSAILYKLQIVAVTEIKGPVLSLSEFEPQYRVMIYLPFLIILFSALRLARYNTEQEESRGFTGFSVTPNAILISSAAIWILNGRENIIARHLLNPYIIDGWVIVISFLLVSRLKMFSLKVSSLRFRDNFPQYIFVFISLPLIIFLRFAGLALSIIAYIIICLFMNIKPDRGDKEKESVVKNR